MHKHTTAWTILAPLLLPGENAVGQGMAQEADAEAQIRAQIDALLTDMDVPAEMQSLVDILLSGEGLTRPCRS